MTRYFATILGIALLSLSLMAQADKSVSRQADPSADKTAETPSDVEHAAPVTIDHRPLFAISAPLAGYSVEERASSIQRRLLAFARNKAVPVSSITVEEHPYWSQVKAGKDTLMYVSEADAHEVGVTRELLAAQNAEIMRRAATQYRSEHTWRNFLRGLLYSILATLMLVGIVFVLVRAYTRIRTGIEWWIASARAKLSLQSKWRLPAAYLGPPLLMLAGLLRWGILLLLFNFYLTVVLGFFPATRHFSRTISAWFISILSGMAQQVVDYLPNLLIVVAIAVVTYYVMRLSGLLFREIGSGRLRLRGFYPDWAYPTARLVRALILVLAAVIIFPYLPGSKSPAFQGISIFVGLLLSLGSSSAVANAVAGTILTYMRSFQLGDYVRVGDTQGEVVEKNLLVTRVCTPKQEIVTIPNATVMSASVTNYSAQATKHGVVLYTTVTIGYDAPWRQIHQLLISAALSTKYILKDPTPFVLQTSLDDFYVSYQINAYTDQPLRMPAIYSELHQNIQDGFNQAGVEIMSPHFSQLRDGNQTTIPANYLPSDYEPAVFQVRSANHRNVSERRKAS